MLRLIRNNSPYTVIILFIFTLLVKLQALGHPQAPVVADNHVLFAWILQMFDVVFRGNAFAYTILTATMLFGQGIYLNATFVKHKLLDKPAYVVAYIYILFTSIHPQFNYFSEMVLVNWCMIAGIDFILGFHQNSQPRKHIFNTGFVISLASLLHFQAIAYLLLFLVAMMLLRSFNIGEWVVGLLGYITPIYMFTCIVFLADKFADMQYWPQIGLSLPRHLDSPAYVIGVITGLMVMVVMGFYALQDSIYRSGLYIRRMWSCMFIAFITSIFISIGSDISEKSVWLLISPSVSLIVAPALMVEKTKWFSNFVLYFSLLFVLFCQWAVK